MTHLHVLLSPRLRTLVLRCLQADQQALFFSALPIIAARCPLLRDVVLKVNLDGQDCLSADSVNKSLVHLFRTLGNLERLDVPLLDAKTLQAIAAVSNLRKLTLSVIPGADFADLGEWPCSFVHLRALSVQEITIDLAVKLVELCAGSPMEVLQLTWTSGPSPGHSNLPALMKAMAANEEWRHSLVSLTIKFDQYVMETPVATPQGITFSVLEPLIVFTELRTLCITTPDPPSLTSPKLREATAGWSRLESLTLEPWSPFCAMPETHIQSLACVVQNCPALLTLTIRPLRTAGLVLSDALAGFKYEPPFSPLKTLDVGRSPLESEPTPTDIAQFLSALFPNLDELWFSPEITELISHPGNPAANDSAWKGRWDWVQQLILVLCEVREEGRTGVFF